MKTIAQMSTKTLLAKGTGLSANDYTLECECVLHLGSDRCRFTIYHGIYEDKHILVKRYNKGEIVVCYFESFEEAVKRMAIRCSNIW